MSCFPGHSLVALWGRLLSSRCFVRQVDSSRRFHRFTSLAVLPNRELTVTRPTYPRSLLTVWLRFDQIWCLYNFAFQLVGDWMVLVGLLLLAYAPMINVVIGEWQSIAQPMVSRSNIRRPRLEMMVL